MDRTVEKVPAFLPNMSSDDLGWGWWQRPPPPPVQPLALSLTGQVLLKLGDNVCTDHILPGGNDVLPLRSNIPAISEYTFRFVDPIFPKRAKDAGGGFVVGGENWGQGSSREHAAIAPMHLGVKAILAKCYARMYKRLKGIEISPA